jgi:hypothetical protein
MFTALWNHEPTKEVFAELRANSVSVKGLEVAQLASAAREFQIGIVIGINERVDDGPGQNTLHNSLLTLSPPWRPVQPSSSQTRPNLHRASRVGTWRWQRAGVRGYCRDTRRRIDLLGTLDASCANGNASSRRAHSRSSLAHRERISAIGQPALRHRGAMLWCSRSA